MKLRLAVFASLLTMSMPPLTQAQPPCRQPLFGSPQYRPFRHIPHRPTGYWWGMESGPGATWSVIGDYGIFTGASRDEERLLHLGGLGPYQPGRADIIDMIEGTLMPLAAPVPDKSDARPAK